MRPILPLFLALTIGLLFACNTATEECPPDQACTMEFRMLNIVLTDSLQQPYLLDSTYTVVHATGELVTPIEQSFDPGTYIVLSDNEKHLTSLQGDTFHFKGFKDGLLKVDEPFVIRHDCCHIDRVSGNTTVTVAD